MAGDMEAAFDMQDTGSLDERVWVTSRDHGVVEQVLQANVVLRGDGGAADIRHDRQDVGADAGGMPRAMVALAAKIERANARNRILVRRLAVEVNRVARLREDLVQARHEAATDVLTGITNRRAFDASLRRAMESAAIDRSARFVLMMVDVDHFKRFNDAFGHSTGDHILRGVARVLADTIRGRDIAARYGGEEFAVLLIGADLAASTTVAQRMCERIAGQRLTDRRSSEPIGPVTVSIGVVEHRVGEAGSDLVDRADAALYDAKRGGRNRVCAVEVRSVAA